MSLDLPRWGAESREEESGGGGGPGQPLDIDDLWEPAVFNFGFTSQLFDFLKKFLFTLVMLGQRSSASAGSPGHRVEQEVGVELLPPDVLHHPAIPAFF